MAALIAISRVMLGVHFFTDILVGSCIGIIIGYGVFLGYKKYLRSVTSNLIT
jgi:undecaprenyl-diphosphatase